MPKVQKRLFSDDEHLKFRISSYGNPSKATEQIKGKLNKDQLEEFKKTCFGHFLNLQTLIHHGQLIQVLGLSKLDYEDNKLIEFNFGGTGAHFMERDFELVSGLNFGDIKEHNFGIREIKTNLIRTTYMNDLTALYKDHLEKQ